MWPIGGLFVNHRWHTQVGLSKSQHTSFVVRIAGTLRRGSHLQLSCVDTRRQQEPCDGTVPEYCAETSSKNDGVQLVKVQLWSLAITPAPYSRVDASPTNAKSVFIMPPCRGGSSILAVRGRHRQSWPGSYPGVRGVFLGQSRAGPSRGAARRQEPFLPELSAALPDRGFPRLCGERVRQFREDRRRRYLRPVKQLITCASAA